MASCVFFGKSHGLRTPNEAFFHPKAKLLGLGRQFGQISFGAFGVLSADLSAPILVNTLSLLSMFSINQPLFLQKTKPLYIYLGLGLGFEFGLQELGM